MISRIGLAMELEGSRHTLEAEQERFKTTQACLAARRILALAMMTGLTGEKKRSYESSGVCSVSRKPQRTGATT
jgi:hypothetical protein